MFVPNYRDETVSTANAYSSKEYRALIGFVQEWTTGVDVSVLSKIHDDRSGGVNKLKIVE